MGFPRFGGHAAIDFANSLGQDQGRTVETLPDFPALLDWLAEIQRIPIEAVRYLQVHGDGARALRQAHDLRALTRQILAAIGTGRSLPSAALPELNRWLGRRLGQIEIHTVQSNQYRLDFRRKLELPEDVLPILAEIVAEFLIEPSTYPIRQCENPECGAYFRDTGKGKRRRWCSMDLCGNRMKVRAHYQRRQSRVAAESA